MWGIETEQSREPEAKLSNEQPVESHHVESGRDVYSHERVPWVM